MVVFAPLQRLNVKIVYLFGFANASQVEKRVSEYTRRLVGGTYAGMREELSWDGLVSVSGFEEA